MRFKNPRWRSQRFSPGIFSFKSNQLLQGSHQELPGNFWVPEPSEKYPAQKDRGLAVVAQLRSGWLCLVTKVCHVGQLTWVEFSFLVQHTILQTCPDFNHRKMATRNSRCRWPNHQRVLGQVNINGFNGVGDGTTGPRVDWFHRFLRAWMMRNGERYLNDS